MAKDKCIRQWVSITSGMRGTFPVLIGEFTDGRNRWSEPIVSGTTCKDYKEALREAKAWADSENLCCDYVPPPPETLTCFKCDQRSLCDYVDDPYNTNGDCLAMK